MAVGIFPIDKVNPPTCWRIANMTIWKNYNFGVYYQRSVTISFILMEYLTVKCLSILRITKLASHYMKVYIDMSSDQYFQNYVS